MKIILRSDFIDYYDAYFDTLKKPEVHHTFHRSSKDRTARMDLFSYMSEQLKLLTPLHGTVREVSERVRLNMENKHVVVYTNEYAHRGDGKERVGLKTALKRHPNRHCSLYMQPDDGTISYRFLSIGVSLKYLMSYKSNHAWKSNVGNVEINLLENPPDIKSYHYPMFAIDFVISRGLPYAVDFNSAPSLAGTPIEKVLKPQTIVEEIRTWMMASMS